MANTSISIIGAGIAGLTLGRCLLHRGIPCVLYERDSLRQFNARHGYGITLEKRAYAPLLPVLRLDEKDFIRSLAVDAAVGGNGRVKGDSDVASFRANRRRLEHMLVEGLDVRWEYRLDSVEPSAGDRDSLSVIFENGEQVHSGLVVGADGPHSQLRKTVSPSSEFDVLPYAVFNGKRRVPRRDYDRIYAPNMDGLVILEHRVDTTLLQLSINDMSDKVVSISYTYSRPAGPPDGLFRPERPNSGATAIPNDLFEEVDKLGNLPMPFGDVFAAGKMREDRLLNWLMRSVLVPANDVDDAASKGIVLLGDAAHHGPILGSHGANEAIIDAVELVEVIAGGLELREYNRARYGSWKVYESRSERQLAEMHGVELSGSRL